MPCFDIRKIKVAGSSVMTVSLFRQAEQGETTHE